MSEILKVCPDENGDFVDFLAAVAVIILCESALIVMLWFA